MRGGMRAVSDWIVPSAYLRAPLTIAAAMAALALSPSESSAQLTIAGQADLLGLNGSDERGLNRNFRSDSPFSPLRARLFAQHWVSERAGVFGEILLDYNAAVRLNGLYVVLNDVGGREWLSARAGLAPSLIGNFGMRSTYFNANPVIGVPLVWQHRSTLDGSGLLTAADLLRRREANFIGLPMLYDGCWNLQWEVMGEVGRFEYSLGLTPGSVSNPVASTTVEGIQTLARLGYVPLPELRVGVSGAIGPYIGGPNRDPNTTATSFPGSPADYQQRVLGFDLDWASGRAHLYSEGYISSWEVPLVEETLSAAAAYVEGSYDFRPAWMGALRVGAMSFSEIQVPDADPGVTTGWDDDVLRFEGAITHRVAREVHVRAGWQHTRFRTGGEEPVNLLAVQLRAVF